MSFRNNPMSEEAAEKARQFELLEPGEYYFRVSKYSFENSQNGNAMIKLELSISHDGKEFKVYDYLVATEKMEWKTRHYCKATGLLKEYEAGQFTEHLCAGGHGWAYINKQLGKQKPDGSWYKDKNVIEDYIAQDAKSDSFVATPQNNNQKTSAYRNTRQLESKGHADLPFVDDDLGVPF